MSMNSKLNLIFVFTLIVFGMVFLNSNIEAQESLISNTILVENGTPLPQVVHWTLAEKIEDGKKLLENSLPLQFDESPQKDKKGRIIKKKNQPVMELTRKEIALAILDTESGRVFEKRYWLSVAEINKANELRKKYLPNPDYLPIFQSSDTNEEFIAISIWWNSFNSEISVLKDGDNIRRYKVVANKYLMANEDLAYPEDRTGKKYSDIVYVPYSRALRDKILVAMGKQFFNDHVSASFNELAEAGVMSKAFPGRLVTDTMTQAFVKNIFLTEQTDPKMMKDSADGGLELVERVFIRLGTNGEKAFRYTVSKTGASGLGQIMPKTYASMYRGYASAQLIKDTEIGRVDVKNGIKATALVLDDHLAGVKSRAYANGKKARGIFDTLTIDKLEEARGMAYNGGPGKYLTSTGGLNTKSRGAKETVDFIIKLRMIRELNLFETL